MRKMRWIEQISVPMLIGKGNGRGIAFWSWLLELLDLGRSGKEGWKVIKFWSCGSERQGSAGTLKFGPPHGHGSSTCKFPLSRAY
jgi:hypothetical protein